MSRLIKFNYNFVRKFSSDRKYVPRRSCLYVPGHDERKINKSFTLNSDCIILDCEDGVSQNQKDAARNIILKTIQNMNSIKSECAVRINSVESGLADQDLDVILSGQKLPDTIFLPKVEDYDHIQWFDSKLDQINKKKTLINLFIYVESARSLLNIHETCIKASTHHKNYQLKGIVFGSDDFCANLGATRSKEASEVLVARQQIIIVAKAFGLQAIDVVYTEFKDLEGLNRQSLEGARMGYTGKQVIHPDQVPVVQTAFSPSQEKIEWARELIRLFEEHQHLGKGAFIFRGNMIDKPLLLQAKNILDISEN